MVLPLDGSPESEAAIPAAVEAAKTLGLPMALLHVVAPVVLATSAATDGFESDVARLMAVADEQAEAYMRAKTADLRAAGVADVRGEVLRGFPATQLLDYAQAHPGSLMVMSTHGRSGIGRFLLGSVTDRVVRYGQSAVLVVRPPKAG